MNNLIIYAHPNPKSFNSAIKDEIVNVSKSRGWDTVIRDLYSMNFDPILTGKDLISFKKGDISQDILTEQEYIRWADVISIIYPLWWTGFPAILKGYFDRVFAYGFAYKYNKEGKIPMLCDKEAVFICTLGEELDFYKRIGMIEALNITSDYGVFGFCGSHVIEHLYFGEVPRVTNEDRKNMLKEVRELYEKIELPKKC